MGKWTTQKINLLMKERSKQPPTPYKKIAAMLNHEFTNRALETKYRLTRQPETGRGWRKQEILTLVRMWKARQSTKAIAMALDHRHTMRAITQMGYRLNLPRRNTNIPEAKQMVQEKIIEEVHPTDPRLVRYKGQTLFKRRDSL